MEAGRFTGLRVYAIGSSRFNTEAVDFSRLKMAAAGSSE
jgi:hypothetical protein